MVEENEAQNAIRKKEAKSALSHAALKLFIIPNKTSMTVSKLQTLCIMQRHEYHYSDLRKTILPRVTRLMEF